MKSTQLNSLLINQIIPLSVNLCKDIANTYGIKDATPEFCAKLSGTLKKYFSYLSFNDFTAAFDYHAQGFLNTDVKVKFSISEITKVIRSYATKKGIDADGKKQTDEWSIERKNAINLKWCDEFEQIFNTYLHTCERTHITLPTFTANVLANIKLINKSDIDCKEIEIHFRLKKQNKVIKSHNQDLIYKAFDSLIKKGEHLGKYLNAYRYRFATVQNELPY